MQTIDFVSRRWQCMRISLSASDFALMFNYKVVWIVSNCHLLWLDLQTTTCTLKIIDTRDRSVCGVSPGIQAINIGAHGKWILAPLHSSVPLNETMLMDPVDLSQDLDHGVLLTSSFVVWLEETKYEWKPVNPTIDQIEKKQMMASRIVRSVKEATLDNEALCNEQKYAHLLVSKDGSCILQNFRCICSTQGKLTDC